jgi:glycosyltransferase involved in cell wall biosynthesis
VRVLYIDSKFAIPGRFAPTRAYSLARRFVERGHTVTMIGRDPSGIQGNGSGRKSGFVSRESVDGIDVVSLNVPYRNDYSKYRRIASYAGFMASATAAGALISRHDVVYASSIPLTIGIPGVTTSKLKRAPFVFELQDVWPAVPIGLGALTNPREIALAERLERTLYRNAAKIVVCSGTQRELVLETGVPADKVVVIPNFAETELFRPDVVDEGWRASLGLEGNFVALYTGGMGRSSGIQQLFDAAVALHERGDREIVLVAYGRGSERPRLEAEARERGLENLRFEGIVERDRIAGIVGASDVTLTLFAPFKVLEQNSPNKFFDSLAAGKPVVVNLDGWLRGLVEEHDAGVYVPGGDGPALADALIDLARRRGELAAMGHNGRALAEREFSRDLLADRTTDLLEDVVRARQTQNA